MGILRRQTGLPTSCSGVLIRACRLFEEVSAPPASANRCLHPRTTQISTRPITADMMPATRNEVSGLSIAVAASRFAADGKAAKSSPSMTNTRPIATRNSAIQGYCRVGYEVLCYRAGEPPTEEAGGAFNAAASSQSI
jgi:hypothetical protein